MTFKLSSELTFPWPVKVMEPDPTKPGTHVLREFEVTFAILSPEKTKASAEARRAILKKAERTTKGENGQEEPIGLDEMKLIQAELAAHDEAALKDIIRGWSKIVDDSDNPISFTDVTFRQLYAYDRIRAAMLTAYDEAISQDRARIKN
jgi:hypothetical protein